MGLLEKMGLTPADGGDEPLYSPAIAQRNRGRHLEAAELVRAQLQRFPRDFQGQMLLAEIQATNLSDLPGAAATIRHICQQPNHSPALVAYALNTLADWHLSLSKDPEAAREILELIIQRFPDSQLALQAEQRLAHLATSKQLMEAVERPAVRLKPGIRNVGLKRVRAEDVIKTKPPDEIADELVRQLEQHPLDLETRERLAMLYAVEFNRLDLAAEQFEQLIGCPNATPRQVAHWLNQLAGLQARIGRNLPGARDTLQRLIDLYPGSGFAQQAAERQAILANEVPTPAAQTMKIGEYEQRLGLKMKRPVPRPGTHS
jgi:outer membrane protein assembly factor BamD (BamD/ComL family)